AENFHLKTTSPLINAGTADAVSYTDIDGEVIPFGSASEIGMDEFVDTDNDTLADVWELTYAANIGVVSQAGDTDSDTLSNIQEHNLFSNPTGSDTDGDTLSDADEFNIYHSNPIKQDTDGDGLLDQNEVNINNTDINNPDTDGDRLPDGWEVSYSLDPLDPADAEVDCDSDTLKNYEEFFFGSNPLVQGSPASVNVSGGNIQNAIDVASGLTIIHIAAGSYFTGLQLKSNIILSGASPASTKLSAGISNSALNGSDISNIIIRNITIGDTFHSGMNLTRVDHMLLYNCVLNNNLSTSNGGGATTLDAEMEFVKCTVSNNFTNGFGGGFYLQYSNASFYDCDFFNNTRYGIYALNSIVSLVDSNFHNQGTASARLRSAVYGKACEITIHGGEFFDIFSEVNGGGVSIDASSIDMRNVVFYDNNCSNNGAAFYAANSIGLLVNNVFFNNVTTRNAGAIGLFSNSKINIWFTTITQNTAALGGGIYNSSSSLSTIHNCIVWNNTDDLFAVSSAMISNSNISDGDHLGTNGNISADPLFRNTAENDYHILSTSPSKDSGSLIDPLLTGTLQDIDNESRAAIILNDIGADEFIDSDNDGLPDFWELQLAQNISPAWDNDSDLITAEDEYKALTNPFDNDTDADGLSDHDEIILYLTDPLRDGDKDGDGLTDSQEILTYFTNPTDVDTDDDLMPDKWEVDNAFDPLDSTDGMLDADNDGLKNNEEFYHGTDPSNDGDPIKVYVDANAVGGGNGTIGSPYNSIATAITSTASSLSVRVLLVIAPGTYTQAVVLKEGIALSGTDAASVRIISHSVASAGIVMNNITGTVIKNITVTDSRLGIDADNSKFIVSGCILQNNSVLPANGGGMVIENSDAVILDSIIQNNRSSNLGGGIYSDNTELILRDSIIRNNRSNSKGGGLYIEDTSLVSFQNVQIKNNSSFVGAGIYSKNAVCSLTGSVISENTSSDQGGGMFTNSGVITIANTVIVQNKSVLDGGGAYFLNNQGIIENSVIVGNTANSNLGNGLFRFNSSLTVRNTIFSNQTPNTTGFLLADVTFCNFTDNDSTFSGLNGNIAVDPLFVNPVLGDYHLNTTSLCIDAGSATSTVVVDIDGESRPENAQVDIGLDEVVDDDNDGLPTAWENRYGQNFVPTGDDDSDTLINSVEFIYGTNPLLADTDNDMLNDFVEINTYATNPLDADSDDDTLSDGAEIITYTSNPLVTDTDNDGMPDGWEALHALNLIVDDANSNFDSDILVNIEEYLLSSEPDNSSSPHVWYVDNDAVGVGTGTIGDPFKQIQSAVDNPLRPSIVQIAEGIYFENVSIVDNGGIVLYAMPSEEAVISGKITDPAVTIKNSGSLVLLKNITIERGQGGIYASGSPVIVKECIIRNSGGSGIVFDRCLGILQVVDSIITRNTSIKGGGVYSIGSAPFIANTVISKNSAQQGGGLYDDQYPEFEHLAPIITNSVIVDNVAPTAGGIYIDSFNSVIDISNTIIWNNGDDLFGAQSTMIHDSNVQDGDFVIGGVNMSSTDPGFASEFYGRYHLLASSAMIDSGSANASAVNDIHGETRPANSAVDIGIDEFIDADNDTLADAWELTYAPNLTILDSAMDSDNDGLINSDEFRYFSNPLAQDTDGDSVADASEISPYHTDPVVVDTDYDGLSDAVEIALGTDPLVSDTDNDGMSDGWESQYGLNPLSSTDGALDLDNDSISNSEEFILNSEPDNSASPQVVYIDNEGIAPGTGTQGDPFVTVSAAINASNPPYIFRLTGAFKENVVFNKNVLLLGSDNQTTSIQAASTSGTTITFNNVLFAVVRNISLKGGKQIVIAEGSTVTFDNCIISNNQTFPSEGGGIKASNSDITVTDTLIQSTRATVRGGAIYANNSSILVDKSTISATQANSSGGALYARSNSDVKINNSRILNAVGSNGGGVFVEFNSSLKLINSAFAKNSANFSGGAVYCQSSDIEISHCAFYKNTRTSGQGSTLFYLLPTSQSMTHSIIWSDDTGNTQQDIAGVDVTLITYSNIEDSIGATNNNISIDPQFAGGEYGNLHVRITSPCRDAGAPSALITTDYDGETRPEGSAVDIGLDEYIDTDADGMPDFFETGYFGN
ncbi:right-handed parallel beta-helix repeat-containing protein, partial [bacterium]|nr:right-handed parallel beta-helix repeat-containing protein [bacterium]